MMRLLLVAVGGAAGALARHATVQAVGPRSFPVAVLAINVSGAFALGVVVTALAARWSPDVVTGLGVGFLGAFTTFSTLAVDTVLLADSNRLGAAVADMGLSVVLGLVAAGAGIAAGRALV
jgi:CrcB protein